MIVKNLAGECLAVRDKITSLDRQIAEVLENHPTRPSSQPCQVWGPS